MTVELPDALATALRRRAETEGRSLSEVVEHVIRAGLDEDPFEFVGIFTSDQVTGAKADDFLRRERFGE